MCVADHKCIHLLLHCDGIEHCHDGSDELHCNSPGMLYHIITLLSYLLYIITCNMTYDSDYDIDDKNSKLQK